MFDLSKVRERAMSEGMKLMGDPRVMKLMSSPQAQKVMMMAFQLPSRIEGAFAKQGKKFAKRFKLATREELDGLKSTIRDLERQLKQVEAKHEQHGKHDQHEKNGH